MLETLTVAILAYNNSSTIHDAIVSVISQKFYPYKLLIIDNGSTDNTFSRMMLMRPFIEGSQVDCRMISMPENKGCAGGLNEIKKYVDTDWVLFLAGDDVLLPKTLLRYSNSMLDGIDIITRPGVS